ncbi:MAG: type I-E CRISPR-associated protein Cas6/Cse3/CasE [Lysobacterales bacterium]
MIFSELCLRPADRESLQTIAALRANPYAQHRAIWQMFDLPPGSRQPFLYRLRDEYTDALRFWVLSTEAPRVSAPWTIRSKPYAPKLTQGEVYEFDLRINPTVTVTRADGRKTRADVVMNTIHHQPAGPSRVAKRAEAVEHGLPEWLAERAAQWGFALAGAAASAADDASMPTDDARCTTRSYQRWYIHKPRAAPIVLGVADLHGWLKVLDAELFQRSLCAGLGHGKAFGLGLMLLRRAAS